MINNDKKERGTWVDIKWYVNSVPCISTNSEFHLQHFSEVIAHHSANCWKIFALVIWASRSSKPAHIFGLFIFVSIGFSHISVFGLFQVFFFCFVVNICTYRHSVHCTFGIDVESLDFCISLESFICIILCSNMIRPLITNDNYPHG